MKRKISLFLLIAFSLLTIVLINAKKVEASPKPAGKIIFHYQLWEQSYDDAGLWVWGTGNGGSEAPVKTSSVDEFGGVYEINIGEDATDVGVIGCRHDIDLDSRWNYRETPDGYNFTIDPTPITSGEVSEMHVYYFQGGYQTYYIANPAKANVLVLYYDPTANYEDTLGVHAWNGYESNGVEMSPAWGTPEPVFKDGFKSPGDIQGKAALLTIDPEKASNGGFLVYAGGDDTKKTPENASNALDKATLTAGSVTVLYVTAKQALVGEGALEQFKEAAFKFDFQQYDATTGSGSYAADPKTIFAKFTLAVTLKQVVGQEPVEKKRIVTKKVPVAGSTYEQYVPAEQYPAYVQEDLDSQYIGRLVIHLQKWDGNYDEVGAYTWTTGTSDDTFMPCGVDDFGAVIEIPLTNAALEDFKFITLGDKIGSDEQWNHKIGGDRSVNIADILNDTVEEIHVYVFEGSETEVFFSDDTYPTILVAYLDKTEQYEENLGFHAWGSWVGVPGELKWGEPALNFVDGFKTPDGIKGQVGQIKLINAEGSGFLVYAGGDESKKTLENASNAITNLAELKPGSVNVVYIYDGVAYYGATSKADFATAAFAEYEEKQVEETYVEMEDVKDFIDFSESFTITQDGQVLKIKQIDYNKSGESTNEFVIILEDAIDNTKDCKVVFNNGLDGDANLAAEINIDLDKEAPVITLLSDQQIKVQAGTKWNDAKFPMYKVTDDRDSNLDDKVYVVPGKGTLNMGKAGTYPITLAVEDAWGNTGEVTFDIIVEAAESTSCGSTASVVISMLTAVGLAAVLLKRKH